MRTWTYLSTRSGTFVGHNGSSPNKRAAEVTSRDVETPAAVNGWKAFREGDGICGGLKRQLQPRDPSRNFLGGSRMLKKPRSAKSAVSAPDLHSPYALVSSSSW